MTPFAGDDLIPSPAAVMDRTAVFDVTAAELWPWVEQLGKGRGRWYAPRWLEQALPLRYRALRHTGDFSLTAGDVVPD